MMNKHIDEFRKLIISDLAKMQGRPVPKEGQCPFCGKDGPFTFKDELSEKDHAITGLCQECQDKTYAEDGTL